MSPLPTGTVTLFFTDMEGSTPLLEQLGDAAYNALRDDFYRILRSACDAHGGREVEDTGDGTHVAFRAAADAVRAAADVQRAMRAHAWPQDVEVRVRIGLHTGAPLVGAGRYVGIDVHRVARVCQAAWGGQTLLTEETQRALASSLPGGFTLRDLGPHRLKGLQRAEQVFQLLHADLPAEFPPVRSLDSLPNNLPRQLTAFVGREREITRVKDLIGASRLVTLTGAGGCGKTRLGLQVAAELVDTYRDGVWFVELAPLSDPSLVAQEVASALRVREQQGRPLLATLIGHLETRTLLLVLDNCEHLVEVCADLTHAILRACPAVRVLTTSREPLAIAGEVAFRVPSLSLPEPDHLPSLDRLAESEAVRLFVDRAATAAGFALTSQNAPLVAHICRRLDGIPLAIELAAARVKVLSLDQIAERLNDRFRLLTGGSRTAMPRQQTLRAAMDWSYALLSDTERRLLARVSVFAGSWTLDAAEAVCAGDGIEPAQILDLVTQLVDKSLVTVDDAGGDLRYRLLETVRQYGRDRLLETRSEHAIQRRHRDWHLRLAAEADSGLRGPQQAEWLARLDVDHDDVRAALDWCLGRPEEVEAGLHLAAAMSRFWWMRGFLTEARRWLSGLLMAGGHTSTAARARALLESGRLAWAQSDYAVAVDLLEQSLALFRDLQDESGVADALNMLGLVAWATSEYARAGTRFEEALARARALPDRHRIAALLSNLGLVAVARGDYTRAEALHRESHELRTSLGDAHGTAISLNNLGLVSLALDDVAGAADRFNESLTIHQRLGNKQHIAHLLTHLALVALRNGDGDRAIALCREGLALSRELADQEGIANALLGLAKAALRRGDLDQAQNWGRESLTMHKDQRNYRAVAECLETLAAIALGQARFSLSAHLVGAATTLRDRIGAPPAPSEREDHAQVMAALRSHWGDLEASARVRDGRTLPLDRAVAIALDADR